MRHCSAQSSFHCLVDEWRDGEELKPKPKEIRVFVDKKVEAKKHRTVWCATTSRYRCIRWREKQQEDEYAREV